MPQRIYSGDTIAAVATAPGEGGVAIVRISGTDALACLRAAFRPCGKTGFAGRRMVFGHVISASGDVMDEAMAVYMKAPKTYTREDVAEIQCHGGAQASGRVLARVLECGARLAQSGEFTRRAFLNGRIDLAQAEAVMQLIAAGGEASARAAVRQMEGGASRFVRREIERLTHALSMIEAADDFPEEIGEEDFLPQVTEALEASRAALNEAADDKGARIVRDGVSVALVGRTNAGKSSLLNALIKQDRAIVTDIPGTTRDVLTETLEVNGVRLEISDTAGQRPTNDAVEAIGVQRAERAQKNADVVVLVLDASEPLSDADRRLLAARDARMLIVRNKTDMPPVPCDVPVDLSVSAKTGEGVDALLAAIVEKSGAARACRQTFTVRRHIEAAREAGVMLESALASLASGNPADIAAADIMAALDKLTEITGENASELVIDRVFKDFCVGK